MPFPVIYVIFQLYLAWEYDLYSPVLTSVYNSIPSVMRERLTYLLQLATEKIISNFQGEILITMKLVNVYKDTFKMVKCHFETHRW